MATRLFLFFLVTVIHAQFFNSSFGNLANHCSSDSDYIHLDPLSNDLFPMDFYCKSITLPNVIKPKYKGNSFLQFSPLNILFEADGKKGFRPICETVGKWEQKYSCVDVLCNQTKVHNVDWNYQIGLIEELTMNETNIWDWLNYCQYCTTGFKNYTSNRVCKSNNFQINQLIRTFPTSMTYCGDYTFGFPLVFNGQSVGTNYFGSIYLCYCVGSDVFSSQCSDWSVVVMVVANVFPIILLSINTLLFIGLSVGSIPKVVHSLKNFKTGKLSNMLPTLFSLLVLASNLVAYPMIISNGLSSINIALNGFGVSIMILAIANWIVSWYRIAYVARNHTQPKVWVIYLLLFILLALTSGLIAGALVLYNETNIGELSLSVLFFGCTLGGIIVLAGFVVSTVWIYRYLKKISDVNIFQTYVSNNKDRNLTMKIVCEICCLLFNHDRFLDCHYFTPITGITGL